LGNIDLNDMDSMMSALNPEPSQASDEHGHTHAPGGGCCGSDGQLNAAKTQRNVNILAFREEFELTREEKSKELNEVIGFLMNKDDLKVGETSLKGYGKINYFKGVNFHVVVLKYANQIISMIPSLINDSSIE